jgi:hypothetical protein
MTLVLTGGAPLHWAIAGAAIAAITLVLLFVANRRLGLSTGFEDVCSLVLAHPYFTRRSLRSGRQWRLPLLAGLTIGGFLSALLNGGWEATWALGIFDAVIGLPAAGKAAWMFAGGLLIGFGTRMAGGCTSGHGIFGLSNFEWPSLLTTLSFMAAGIATTNIIYRWVFA